MVRWPKIEISLPAGPKGITAIAMKAGMAATIAREDVDHLVRAFDDDVFLEHQFHAVGERLEHAPGAVPVGTDAQLHPGDDLTAPDDGDQHGHHEEGEAEHRLTTTSHQGSRPNIERSSSGEVRPGAPPPWGCQAICRRADGTRELGRARCRRRRRRRLSSAGARNLVGHLGDLEGKFDRAGRAGDGQGGAVGDARLGGRRGGHARACGVPGAGERLVALPLGRPRSSSSLWPASDGLAGGRAGQRARALHGF